MVNRVWGLGVQQSLNKVTYSRYRTAFHSWDEISETCNLKQEGFILVHGFSAQLAGSKADISQHRGLEGESCPPPGS